MSVRAKFYVTAITPQGPDGSSIALSPVCSGSPENERFFKYTPSGQIQIGTVNAEAVKQFEVGKESYVDFTAATPDPTPTEPTNPA